MSLKTVILFWDGFILLMYKSLGKKEIVNKHHKSRLCPFKFIVQDSEASDYNYNIEQCLDHKIRCADPLCVIVS